MYPWFWLWSPQFYFPFSGDVYQDVDPTTSWFFKGIKPEAGNAKIEEKAFGVATYGTQLGLITEVLIELAEKSLDATAASAGSLNELKRIQSEIEKIKEAQYDSDLSEIETMIVAIQRRGGERSAALSKKLQALSAKSEP